MKALATASMVFCTKYIAAGYDVLEIPEAAAQCPNMSKLLQRVPSLQQLRFSAVELHNRGLLQLTSSRVRL